MSKIEPCILTNMCMIQSGDKVLVLDRCDPQWPGITFPGGHVEPGESFVDSVIREVKEETGLDISHVKLCGMKQWTQSNGDYRYIVLFYKTDTFSGELEASREGNVFWVHKDDLGRYTVAEGFEGMLEVFLQEDLSENYHWLEDGQWHMQNK